jgi:hypothetical protein
LQVAMLEQAVWLMQVPRPRSCSNSTIDQGQIKLVRPLKLSQQPIVGMLLMESLSFTAGVMMQI